VVCSTVNMVLTGHPNGTQNSDNWGGNMNAGPGVTQPCAIYHCLQYLHCMLYSAAAYSLY